MEEISFSPVSSFLICFPFTKSYCRIVFFVEMKKWERTGWKTEVTATPPNLIENVWVDFWESLCIKIDFDWRKAKSRKFKEMTNWIIYSHANKCRPHFPYNIYTTNRNTYPWVIHLIVVYDIDFLLVSVSDLWSSYLSPNVNRTLHDSQLDYFHHWRCCPIIIIFWRERERQRERESIYDILTLKRISAGTTVER